MVAAGATVTRPVETHESEDGTPARHLGWVCQCGAVMDESWNGLRSFCARPVRAR